VGLTRPLAQHSGGAPYPLLEPLEQKRFLARSLETVYVYDFVELFEASLLDLCAPC
jgi:hypothetical protein